MAEGNPPDRSKRVPPPDTGPPSFMFGDDPPTKTSKPRSKFAPGSSAGDVFELVEQPEHEASNARVPTPPVPPAGPKAQGAGARPAAPKRTESQSHLDPAALVGQVWSRTAEWGTTLVVLGIWGFVSLGYVYYQMFYGEYFSTAFFGLLVAGLVAAVLAYPILITLERPVRITPELALRDYYGAISHHLPHFKRMWLLLSSAGRASSSYGSYDGFKAYWKAKLKELRQGHAGPTTPLVFEVADFSCEKSAGLIRVDVEFTVKVFVRGKRKGGAIQTFPKRIALVRGPDQMWYIEDGTLTRPPREPKPANS